MEKRVSGWECPGSLMIALASSYHSIPLHVAQPACIPVSYTWEENTANIFAHRDFFGGCGSFTYFTYTFTWSWVFRDRSPHFQSWKKSLSYLGMSLSLLACMTVTLFTQDLKLNTYSLILHLLPTHVNY